MLAWRKIEKLFVPGDVWFDPLKLAAFKYRLKDHIEAISEALLSGTYIMHPIVPVPFPKNKKENDKELPIRQSFIIDVADQLVWVAVCNVIGVYLDTRMPAWSYGNRLYLHWWKDKNDKWQIGNYRNSTPALYRKWNQSWPMMRKRITVSLKLLAGMERHLTKEEREIQEKEIEIPDKTFYAKLKYLETGYFPSRVAGSSPDKELYWCGIDLKKFYPHVKMSIIVERIIGELKREKDNDFVNLLNTISSFKLDTRDYAKHKEELESMGLYLDEVNFDYLPTGLLVAGFLANVYMLDIDRKADDYLDKHRDVIHFRYVDDHVMVARTKDALGKWVDEYVSYILDDTDEGLEINFQKAEPKNVLGEYDNEGKIRLRDYKRCNLDILEEYGKLDPFYPTPLMTQTLQKVSMLSKEKLPLLTATEFEIVFKDLQTMLVTDIPEQEISKQTRISFACTMLSRLLLDGNVDYHKVHEVRKSLYAQAEEGRVEGNEEESKRRIALLYKEKFEVNQDEKEKFTAFDYEQYERLGKTVEAGHLETKDNAETVFFLLRRAIREVPEKVKVWVRTFNFAVNHYPQGIKHLVDELNAMRANPVKLHPLGVLYLESVVEMLAAESIIAIISRLEKDDYLTSLAKNNDIASVQQLVGIDFKNEGFFFKDVTKYMMCQARYCYYRQQDSLALQKIDEVAPVENVVYDDGTTIDETLWKIWMIESSLMSVGDFEKILRLIDGNRGVSSSSPYFEALLYVALTMAGQEENGIKALLPEHFSSEGLSKDLLYAMAMADPDRNPYGIKIKEVEKSSDYISLQEWLVKTSSDRKCILKEADIATQRNKLNEAVYSEWMSVRLMLSIVNAVQNELNGEDSEWTPACLHPATILIKNDKPFRVTWESRGDDNSLFEIKLLSEPIEGAGSYYSIPQLYDTLPQDNSVCYSLGLIFLHILTKHLYFPWIMNSPDYGFEWLVELNKLLNRGEVSTVNYRIVEECLTSWNRETVRMIRENKFVEDGGLFRRDDDDFDNKILTIGQLEKRLTESYEIMKNNLISVPGNSYRQLIEISVL